MHVPNVDIVASSSGTLRLEHRFGVFAKHIKRAALLAIALGVTVVLGKVCSSAGTGFDARLLSPVPIGFLRRLARHRTSLNRTTRIRNLVSYYLRGDVLARSAVQARQRVEGAR